MSMWQPRLLGEWEDKTTDDVKVAFGDYSRDFSRKVAPDESDGFTIIVANYTQGGYEGYAQLLTEKNGAIFETYASHCSCYDLEGQWDPKPVTRAYVEHRCKNAVAESDYNGTKEYLAACAEWLAATAA